MTVFASIGAAGLYLLFAWLLSAAIASWLSDRKGYGERVGLTFGLLLSVVGLAIVGLLPARPGSAWKIDGPLPRRRHPGRVVTGPAIASVDVAGPAAPPAVPDGGTPAVPDGGTPAVPDGGAPTAPDGGASNGDPDSGSEPPPA